MDLTLLFDHRFYQDQDGLIFSLQTYNYSFFAKRYLPIFDRVRILARVSNNPPRKRTDEYTIGQGVELVSLGNWNGPVEFISKRQTVLEKLHEYIFKDTAVLMIAPGTISSLARKQLAKAGYPYGLEVVGDPYDMFAPGAVKHPLRPFFRWWFPQQLRQQCAGACASAYVTKQALQSRYPCPAYSVGVSDVHISETALVSAPRPLCKEKDQFTLITVATLAQLYKAPDVLIKAVAVCVQEGLDIKLVLVGDGKFRSQLEAQAASLGLKERVCFRGQLPAGDAVRSELDQADLFLLPSYQEGLPRAMVEAMARGLPCIGSNVGGIPELLPPEDMVSPGDVTVLAQKIREVITNSERLANMSAHSLEKAMEYQEDILWTQRYKFYEYLRETTETWLKANK